MIVCEKGADRRVGAGLYVGSRLLDAVAIDVAVADFERVTGQADHALDVSLAGGSPGRAIARLSVPGALLEIAALPPKVSVGAGGWMEDDDGIEAGCDREPVDQDPFASNGPARAS